MMHPVRQVVDDTRRFYQALWYFLVRGGTWKGCPYFTEPEDLQAKVTVYGFFLDLYLWDKPHYRGRTYRQDMLKNLGNVVIPGTGVPLSAFCYSKVLAYYFLFFLYPMICLVGAITHWRKGGVGLADAYRQRMLYPKDWCYYWRQNSRLAGFHELMTKAKGYAMEDKWTFLVQGEEAEVPVSPFLRLSSVVIKKKDEERGGQSMHLFKNALVGGEWIMQEKLDNSEFLKILLPQDAPLSTIRVVTASKGGLTPEEPTLGYVRTKEGFEEAPSDLIQALSAVFRAGRAGRLTDESGVIFDIDIDTGVVGGGQTYDYWYEVGWKGACQILIAGAKFQDFQELLKLVRVAHYLLLPDVPIAGWDVALTNRGVKILQVKCSCEDFLSSGNGGRDKYFKFVDEYYRFLDRERMYDVCNEEDMYSQEMKKCDKCD